MRQYLFKGLIFLCLLAPVSLMAGDLNPDQDVASPIIITLTEYRELGYKVLGPIQFLGKGDGQIKLYRNEPVSYKRLDVINEFGEAWLVRKYNFVYVLSKDNHVVLIRLDKKEGNDV